MSNARRLEWLQTHNTAPEAIASGPSTHRPPNNNTSPNNNNNNYYYNNDSDDAYYHIDPSAQNSAEIPSFTRDSRTYNENLRLATLSITTCLICTRPLEQCTCCRCQALIGQPHTPFPGCGQGASRLRAPPNTGLWRKVLFNIVLAEKPIVMPTALWEELQPWVSNIWILNGKKLAGNTRQVSYACRYHREKELRRMGQGLRNRARRPLFGCKAQLKVKYDRMKRQVTLMAPESRPHTHNHSLEHLDRSGVNQGLDNCVKLLLRQGTSSNDVASIMQGMGLDDKAKEHLQSTGACYVDAKHTYNRLTLVRRAQANQREVSPAGEAGDDSQIPSSPNAAEGDSGIYPSPRPTKGSRKPSGLVRQRKAQIIQAPLRLAITGQKSIFLAGTTSGATDWREKLTTALSDLPVTFFNPLRPDWDNSWKENVSFAPFRVQVEWELEMQEQADLVVVYFGAGTVAPISMLELGLCARAGKAMVACHGEYWKKGNVQILCQRFGIEFLDTEDDLAQAISKRIEALLT